MVSRGQSGAALRRRWTVKRGIYGASCGEDNIVIVLVVRMHARQRDKSRDEKGNPRGLRRGGDGGSRNSFKVHVRTQVEAPLRQTERLYKGRRINPRRRHCVVSSCEEKSANR